MLFTASSFLDTNTISSTKVAESFYWDLSSMLFPASSIIDSIALVCWINAYFGLIISCFMLLFTPSIQDARTIISTKVAESFYRALDSMLFPTSSILYSITLVCWINAYFGLSISFLMLLVAPSIQDVRTISSAKVAEIFYRALNSMFFPTSTIMDSLTLRC